MRWTTTLCGTVVIARQRGSLQRAANLTGYAPIPAAANRGITAGNPGHQTALGYATDISALYVPLMPTTTGRGGARALGCRAI